jgi:hypothetical protein
MSAQLMNRSASTRCEVGFNTYNAVGQLQASSVAGSALFETFDVDASVVSTCIEVCTVYTTSGVKFTSTYRTAGNADLCGSLTATYEALGEPYNTEDAVFVHSGWREDEYFPYSATTTVLCCTESNCNALCPALPPPSLSGAAVRCAELAAGVLAALSVAAALLGRR